MSIKSTFEKISGILLIGFILLLWETSVRLAWVDTPSLPRVTTISDTLVNIFFSGQLINEILPSLKRVFAGFLIACAVAIPLGVAMGSVKFIHSLFEPITEFLRPIPSAGYVPLAILFLGIGDEMIIFVISLSCLFPILLSTQGGVRGVDPVLIDTGRTFGLNRMRILLKIVVPSVLPEIFTGMRIGLGIALIVVVVSEMIAGNSGIGYFILSSQQFFRIPEMYVGIFTLGVIGYILNWSFLLFEKRILRWRP